MSIHAIRITDTMVRSVAITDPIVRSESTTAWDDEYAARLAEMVRSEAETVLDDETVARFAELVTRYKPPTVVDDKAAGACQASSVTECYRDRIVAYASLAEPHPSFGPHW